MKKLVFFILSGFYFMACQPEEGEIYTANELVYNLFPASDYDYQGTAILREFLNGDLELTITLEGNKGDGEAYYFPAHLHYGAYDSPDAPMAAMLNPIDIRILKSTTVLGPLSRGETLRFDDFKDFDGHIKVHLADSGPDYAVILVVGNVGKNDNSTESYQRENMTICSPYY